MELKGWKLIYSLTLHLLLISFFGCTSIVTNDKERKTDNKEEEPPPTSEISNKQLGEYPDTIQLIPLNEKVGVEKNLWCGCEVGMTIFEGEYALKFGKSMLNIGSQSFCQGNKLHSKTITTQEVLNNKIFILYQYASCNGHFVEIYGYDKKKEELFQYLFKYENHETTEQLFTSGGISINNTGAMKNKFYSNVETKLVLQEWKINVEQREILLEKSMPNPHE